MATNTLAVGTLPLLLQVHVGAVSGGALEVPVADVARHHRHTRPQTADRSLPRDCCSRELAPGHWLILDVFSGRVSCFSCFDRPPP